MVASSETWTVLALAPLSLALNLGVVCSTRCLRRLPPAYATTHFLLLNIALADLLSDLIYLISAIYPEDTRSSLVCSLEVGVLIGCTLVASLSTCLMAVDRYLSLLCTTRRPLSSFTVRGLLASLWFLTITIGVVPSYLWIRSRVDPVGHCWYIDSIPPAVVYLIGVVMLFAMTTVLVTFSAILRVAYSRATPRRRVKARSALVTFLCAIFMLTTWCPFTVSSVLYLAFSCTPDTCIRLCWAVTSPLATLGMLNSLFNPVLYSWWHRPLTQKCKQFCIQSISGSVHEKQSPCSEFDKQLS